MSHALCPPERPGRSHSNHWCGQRKRCVAGLEDSGSGLGGLMKIRWDTDSGPLHRSLVSTVVPDRVCVRGSGLIWADFVDSRSSQRRLLTGHHAITRTKIRKGGAGSHSEHLWGLWETEEFQTWDLNQTEVGCKLKYFLTLTLLILHPSPVCFTSVATHYTLCPVCSVCRQCWCGVRGSINAQNTILQTAVCWIKMQQQNDVLTVSTASLPHRMSKQSASVLCSGSWSGWRAR